jgi:tRNA dimethylallyltransferase
LIVSAAPPILPILTGPTASGKTALAIEVASRLGMEILSADSRQVYRGLEVATAAPSPEELASVRHHLISHVSPFEEYSAGRFCRETRAVLGLPEEGASPGSGLPGRLPYLVCGGSGFYLRAFLDPVHPALGSRPELREKVKALGRELGDDGLKAELLSLDPEAEWIPAADRTKIERYLEISLASGMPASRAMRELVLPRPVTPRIFALHAPISWLGSRIRKRAWWMLRHGMVEEIRQALEAGVSPDGNALKSVGVKEVRQLLEGRADLPFCQELLARSTRQYAKKQLTWIRSMAIKEELVLLDATRPMDVLVTQIVEGLKV